MVMDSTPRIFFLIMLTCFGSSWPFAVAKTLLLYFMIPSKVFFCFVEITF